LERKLTAILCADVHGYSRLMEDNEEATLRTLSSYRKIIDGLIEQHRGRFVGSAGDSVLAEFASVVNAVHCAVEIQTALKDENTSLPPERRMEFRIGVNLGDVMVEAEQIFGDGVNVAARLEGLAEPGGICISGKVHEEVKNKLALRYEDLGEQAVKNIAAQVRVWRVLLDGMVAIPAARRQISRKYWRGGVLSLTGLVIAVAAIVLVQHLSLRSPRTAASIPPQEKPGLSLPNIPSIAVLPFTNLSGDPQQEYFSDGITDDLVTDLSRVPGLFVIDRGSTFAYKHKPAKVQEVGRELGVKYVLEGSARKVADQVRINVQLVDGQRYDKHFRDIFKLQDEIVQSLVATLNLQLTVLHQGYVLPQRTNNLEAYDYYLRGFEYFLSLTPDGFAKAGKMLDKAIQLDSGYADAYALLSFSSFVGWIWQWDPDPGVLDRAAELANKSIALDDSESGAYAVLAWIAAMKDEHDQAIADGERAVSLAPNSALGYEALADINVILSAGHLEEAVAYAQKAMRLDPRHRDVYLMQEGLAYCWLGRFAEAVDALKKGQKNNPYIHMNLVWAYSELGREQEARAEAAEVMRLSSRFSLEETKQRINRNWQKPRNQRFLADLRRAGLK
jgi:TolB-like protein/class 3 adenylate cyclase